MVIFRAERENRPLHQKTLGIRILDQSLPLSLLSKILGDYRIDFKGWSGRELRAPEGGEGTSPQVSFQRRGF